MEGQGTFFPGHKQKQRRSGPFSRELPRSWEHGGARQASPTCPARQLARTPAPPLGSAPQCPQRPWKRPGAGWLPFTALWPL